MKIIQKIVIVSLLFGISLNAEETKNIKLPKDVNKTTSTKVMKTMFFPLKHYNAAIVRTKIKPLVGEETKILSFKRNNLLVIRAYPKSIKRVQEVINEIESMNPRDVRIVKFKKAPVNDIYPTIKSISKSLFAQDIVGEKVKVIDSNTTNSLILVGKKENMERLLKYMELLDIDGGFVSKTAD